MRITLRHVLFAAGLASSCLVAGSCSDDDEGGVAPVTKAALPRPGLPRPPTGGLPAELRPPR